jgi:hypothetical protein
MTDRSKIRGQRMSGANVQQQRELATAIKNAREMALLPYTKRTVSTRAPRVGRDDREDESTLEMPEQTVTSAYANVDIAEEVETENVAATEVAEAEVEA